MKIHNLLAGLLAATLAASLVGVPGSAQAATVTAAEFSDSQRELAEVMNLYPGSRQISSTAVEIKPGVEFHLPAAKNAVTTLDRTPDCAVTYLCVWEHSNYEGRSLRFYRCKKEDLGQMAYPDGGTWGDRVSSYHNNQVGASDGRARFIDMTGSGTERTQLFVLPDTSGNMTEINENDKMDRIVVCP